MTTVDSRPYSSQNDLGALLAFLRTNRPPERIRDFPSIADLQEMLADPAIQASTRLWMKPDGSLAAFAVVDPSCGNLAFESESDTDQPWLEDAAIEWGCSQAAALNLPDPLETGYSGTDAGRRERLIRAGFYQLPESTLVYERSLVEALPDPCIPEGYSIRPLQGEEELDEIVHLHRLACGSEQMTPVYRRAMMQAPAYIPELDLVAVDPQGHLAAYCTCWISDEENRLTGSRVGYTDPIGTRPDCRRLGLAQALLYTGFRLLKSRGMQTASLSTSSTNHQAMAAFENAGYKLGSTRSRFALQKPG